MVLLWTGLLFCFKQKTAYEMRISDWSSDVCSSDLAVRHLAREHRPAQRQGARPAGYRRRRQARQEPRRHRAREPAQPCTRAAQGELPRQRPARGRVARWRSGAADATALGTAAGTRRSEEHTSELQSLMRISYAVFFLK